MKLSAKEKEGRIAALLQAAMEHQAVSTIATNEAVQNARKALREAMGLDPLNPLGVGLAREPFCTDCGHAHYYGCNVCAVCQSEAV